MKILTPGRGSLMVGSIEEVRQVGRKGYTLIELVTVVGIIIVLVMAAMPSFTLMM